MIAAGTWAPTETAKETGLVGFHLPAMISTLGVTLQSLAEKWLSARAKGKESLRVFVNTSLAEGWEDRGARMEPNLLLSRRESYGEHVEVPMPAVALVAGVDVQDNRFEMLVTAWGRGEERWVVESREVPGNPKHAETQAALWTALQRKYSHASGHLLPILATCIDSGFATDAVYDFVLAYQARGIYATKGIAGRSGEPIVGKAADKRRGKDPRPIRLRPINVDDAKNQIVSSLSLAAPGPGYIHFPAAADEEFFAQLCAEHRETRYNRSGIATHVVWVKDRDRNEVLDMSVLCLAAFRLLNPNILQMAKTIAETPVPGGEASRSPTRPAKTDQAPPPARRIARSGYLGR